MNNIIQEISLLYELSLTIGSSLEFKKNAESFIKILLSRKNLNKASIWLNRSFVDTQATNEYEIAYEFPIQIHKTLQSIEGSKPTIKAFYQQDHFNLIASEQDLFYHDQEQEYITVFKLEDVGFLCLYHDSKHLSKIEVNQLTPVVKKFAISLRACLIYDLSNKQLERIDLMSKFPEQNPNPVIRISRSGQILYYNKASQELLKVLEVNESLLFQKSIKEIVQNVLIKDEILELEIKTDTTYYSLTFTPIKKYNYVNIYGKNISNIKEALSLIDHQKIFYENILNSLPTDVVAFDKDHNYTFVNPVAIKDEATRKWIIGKNDTDYFKKKNLNLDRANSRKERFNKAKSSRSEIEWEEQIINQDNKTEYHIRKMKPVFDNMGKLEMMIGYGINITKLKAAEIALKENEEKFRTVFNQSNDGIIIQDQKGNVLDANDKICALLQYTKQEILTQNILQLLPKNSIGETKKVVKTLNEKGYLNFEFHLIRKDGISIPVEISASKINIGNDHYFHGTIRDITERKKRDLELINAKNTAERSVRAKETFLANMSHEIRTPMNAILGLSKLLEDEPLSATQKKRLHTIQGSGQNLLVIINDILDFSKIESGKLQFESVGFKLNQLCENLMSVLSYKTADKDVNLIHNLNAKLGQQILIGDPTRLNQILLNLMSNAIKFTEHGEVKLSIETKHQDKNNVNILFCVSDTGIGIEQDKIESIFSSFAQADVGTTRKYGGTGLGLSITKKLVTIQGGKIWAESTPKKGSKFYFELEFQKGSQSDLIKEEITASINKEQLTKLKILLVEDNKINQFYATSILEKWNIESEIAENGQQAISMLKKHPFDLILMDMQMPVMDGLQATRIIRKEISKTLPIIALTANAIRGDDNICFQAGMNDYISKPFKEEDLVSKLQKYAPLEQKRASKTLLKSSKMNTLYDLSTLESSSGGNTAFVKKMIQLFVDETPGSIEKIKKGLVQQDYAQIRSAAHKIKPSFQILNIIELKEDIKQLELMASTPQESNFKEKIEHLVKKLTDRMPSVFEALNKELE